MFDLYLKKKQPPLPLEKSVSHGQGGRVWTVAQEALMELEMYVLVALLEAYPHYCPYEVVQAAITDEVLNHAQPCIERSSTGH